MGAPPQQTRRVRVSELVLASAIALVALLGIGCKPQIGDSCKLSTDCSVTGDRLCDTSQPDGYCTIFNCEPDTCPGTSTCVEFHPKSDRFVRRFCLATCGSPGDCRSGYVCIDPAKRDAHIIDSSSAYGSVCLP